MFFENFSHGLRNFPAISTNTFPFQKFSAEELPKKIQSKCIKGLSAMQSPISLLSSKRFCELLDTVLFKILDP